MISAARPAQARCAALRRTAQSNRIYEEKTRTVSECCACFLRDVRRWARATAGFAASVPDSEHADG